MGIKAAYERFASSVYPAPVAPFVSMVAKALEDHPGEFTVRADMEARTITMRLHEYVSNKVDLDMVAHGVGVRVNFDRHSDMTITTHYFDDVELNWREKRLLKGSIQILLAAYRDASKQFLANVSNDMKSITLSFQ